MNRQCRDLRPIDGNVEQKEVRPTNVCFLGRSGKDLLTVSSSFRRCTALLKNEQDVHLFERLAFMARRESR